MRLLLIKAFLIMAAGAFYLASPFVTAWQIREAVKTGDAAYLNSVVEWGSVKETIKPSLARMVVDAPAGAQADVAPSLWQRLKAYAGRSAVDRMVDNYLTPEGLPSLLSWGRTYREKVRGQIEEPAGMSLPQRIQAAWARVKRAEFVTPTRFEMAMADKFAPNRIYAGVLEFRADGWNSGWKLTELRLQDANLPDASLQEAAGPTAALASRKFATGRLH